MSNKPRSRNESVCEFLCFRQCDKKYVSDNQNGNSHDLKTSKLSLKKVMQDEHHHHKFTRSTSDKNLNDNNYSYKLKAETSRSQNETKQLLLFKKKVKLEHEIERVDQEMSRLTLKYQKNITQLRTIKKQLESLRGSDE